MYSIVYLSALNSFKDYFYNFDWFTNFMPHTFHVVHNDFSLFMISYTRQEIMSKPPILISDLKPGQHVWKIYICVVDLWIVKEHNGQQHVKSIIQDTKVLIIYFLCCSFFGKLSTNYYLFYYYGGQIHVVIKMFDYYLFYYYCG